MKNYFSRNAVLLVLCAVFIAVADDVVPDVVTVTAKQIQMNRDVLTQHQYFSSDQPNSDTLAIIAEAGFSAVIDLRTDEENRGFEEADEVAKLGMQYFSIPISGPADMTYENALKLDQVLAGLHGPVLLHCASGNRVGALFALREKQNGASAEEALEIGRQAGLTRSENAVKSRLAEN